MSRKNTKITPAFTQVNNIRRHSRQEIFTSYDNQEPVNDRRHTNIYPETRSTIISFKIDLEKRIIYT